MSNSRRDLDTVISSQRDLDEHYRLMASEQQLEENSGGSDSDETTDDDMGDDEATDDVGDERTGDAETTDSGAAGDAETTDSGAAGDAEPKKQRKQRRPNRVGATKETFFAVNPQTGLPTHPPELARGYGLQLVNPSGRRQCQRDETPNQEKGTSASPTPCAAALAVPVP